jgi:hypothetical protein
MPSWKPRTRPSKYPLSELNNDSKNILVQLTIANDKLIKNKRFQLQSKHMSDEMEMQRMPPIKVHLKVDSVPCCVSTKGYGEGGLQISLERRLTEYEIW